MPKKISTLNPGNLVKLNEAGMPIQFIFLEYNHYGKNEVTLIQKDLYNRHYQNWVSRDSNGLYVSFLDYYCMVQYINLLDPTIRACLVPIDMKLRVMRENSTSFNSSTLYIYKRSCFLPSSREYGCTSNTYSFTDEGTAFSYFSSNSNRTAYPRDEWYYKNNGAYYSQEYLTRSLSNLAGVERYFITSIDEMGSFKNFNFSNENISEFIRIAITLSSDIMVSDTTDSDGCYNIVSVPAAENYQKVNGVWMKMV